MTGADPSHTEGVLDTPDDLLAWIKTNRPKVGLAAFEEGREAQGLFVNADRPFPLASTRQVLILGAYAVMIGRAEIVASEAVPLTDLDRWYLPGLDGGHDRAMADARRRGAVADDALTIDEVVGAMIRWSDNAAADCLLARVGGPTRALAFANRMRMRSQDPPTYVFGDYVAWATIPDEWQAMAPQERAEVTTSLAEATSVEEARRLPPPPVDVQSRLASATTSGSPRSWARLIGDIYASDKIEAIVRQTMAAHLDWPMRASTENKRRFDQLAGAGGSMAGVITDLTYAKAKRRPAYAIALFLRDLPPDVWTAMSTNLVGQRFILGCAKDPDLLERVRRNL